MKRPRMRHVGNLVLLTVISIIVFTLIAFKVVPSGGYADSRLAEAKLRHFLSSTKVIIITPTRFRYERYADFIRFSQTLMHISNLLWIVVEDGKAVSPSLDMLLLRSKIPFVYFAVDTEKKPRHLRGSYGRNAALAYIRQNMTDERNAVVYFADDDNSYDIRLFNDYIRQVTTVGVWPVGLVGQAKVEYQIVEYGQIVRWVTVFDPMRKYAVDMAGFATHISLIHSKPNATFHEGCKIYHQETCFLEQLINGTGAVVPFGYDSMPREIFVWHTRTEKNSYSGSATGFIFEEPFSR